MNENSFRQALIAGLCVVLMTALPGCATKKQGEPIQTNTAGADDDGGPADNSDPFEFVNRGIFKFNEVVDGLILKPIAHIYLGVMPEFGQRHVKDFLTNLTSPVVFLNSALQGDKDNMSNTFGRFLINSTVGVAGVFDMASEMGIPKAHDKDFGQTLGVWGVGTGPYITLPILGPSDTRDTLGFVVDIVSDPFTWILNSNATIAYETARGVVLRADLLPLTDRIHRDSLDPYTSYRSIYLQHRGKVVRDYLGADANIEYAK